MSQIQDDELFPTPTPEQITARVDREMAAWPKWSKQVQGDMLLWAMKVLGSRVPSGPAREAVRMAWIEEETQFWQDERAGEGKPLIAKLLGWREGDES